MAYSTGNPLGSTDPRDLSDNSEIFDKLVNNTTDPTVNDRFGNPRITLANQLGYNFKGDYAAGIELISYTDIIRYNSEFYRPSASATLPYTTTATLPDADSNLVPVGDANLRQELALSPSGGQGAALVNGATIYVGSVAELEALSLPAGTNVYLTEYGRAGEFVVKSGTPPSDPQKGIYIALASGNFAERTEKAPIRAEWFSLNVTDAIEAALDILPQGGGIVDATYFEGPQTLDRDIFATRNKPFTLIFGAATFDQDLSSSRQTFNSHQHFVLNGTKFQPDVANPDVSGGFFQSNVTTTTGSISSGSNRLTVADSSRIEVGSLLAIQGAQATDGNEEKTLSSGIDASQTTIPVSGITSTIPSTYIFIIDNEIISGTSKDGSNLLGVTRGAFGTTSASHSSGAAVSFLPNMRAIVTDISGTAITLDRAADQSVSASEVSIGTVGSTFSGKGVIDGRIDRDGPDRTNSFGISLPMAKDCLISEGIDLQNWEHGGLYIESGYYNVFKGSVSGNARPSLALGASIWVFRGSVGNRIEPSKITDGNIGIFIDDRTSSANLMDGPSDGNLVILPSVIGHEAAVDISGSLNNTVFCGDVNAKSTALRIATNSQGENPRAVAGNVIHAGNVVSSIASAVIRGQKNIIHIEATDGLIDAQDGGQCVVSSGASSGRYLGIDKIGGQWNYYGYTDTHLTINCGEPSLALNDVLGGIQFYSAQDASGPGPGVKAAIRAQTDDNNGSTGRLSFYAADGAANDVEKARLKFTGDFELLENAAGIILKSPNGTAYTVTVTDAGALVVT